MSKNCCFTRNSRLRKSKEFAQVYKDNQICIKGRYFVVLAFLHDKDKQILPRLGVVASKKVSKRAVVRNRLKRVAREYFRLNDNIATSFDYICIAKIGAATVDNKFLYKDLANIWRRVKKQCDLY